MIAEKTFEKIKGIHDIPKEEFYSSGHRTCEGCDSALVMRLCSKVAGPRTIAIGTTGCMYVANTSYMTTPWVIPWMHSQLGAGGSAAIGTAAGLRALMHKGRDKEEKVNVIAFCGDLGGADMGLSAISAALQTDYHLLIVLYDNESAANTDIQATGMTTWGAQTTFTPTGSEKRITQRRWKKNITAMLAAGHPNIKYFATSIASYPLLDLPNKVKKALTVEGPAFIHVLAPCPKGWDYNPRYTDKISELAAKTGIFPVYEIEDGEASLTYEPKPRAPVREYLEKQGRFSHFKDEDYTHIQERVDEMWESWEIPGIMPIKKRASTEK